MLQNEGVSNADNREPQIHSLQVIANDRGGHGNHDRLRSNGVSEQTGSSWYTTSSVSRVQTTFAQDGQTRSHVCLMQQKE